MNTRIETDLLVIGAGSGGLSVAAGAAQMGARVVLVEAAEMGGDCLNTGCVPSKTLLAAARAAQARRRGAPGLAPAAPDVDYAAVMDHVQAVIARIAPIDSQERFEALGVTVIRARARFLSPREVAAGDHVIAARRVVLATGAVPVLPPLPGLDRVPYLTHETLWSLRTRPAHLLILGGGPIGVEMAQAHARLGASVTLVEADRILPRDDPEAVALLRESLSAEGVKIIEGARVTAVGGRAGAPVLDLEGGARIAGSHLLIATGRRPDITGLNLAAAGIETTETGIRTDAGLRSTNRRVYAIGDAAGGLQFTHLAGYQAGIVLRSALFGLPARARQDHIPRVTYCDPELAQIGLTEAEARARHGAAVEIARFDYADNDRALAEGRDRGFVKLMVRRGRPLGVTIVGHQAGELAGIWSLALAGGLKLGRIAGMVSPYPSISELNKRVAGAYFSPRLFENRTVKRVVGLVQRWIP